MDVKRAMYVMSPLQDRQLMKVGILYVNLSTIASFYFFAIIN